TPKSWGPHVKREAFDLFNIQRIPKKKIMCTVFNKEMRMLHYLINYILMPRSTGHSHVTIDDLVTMWAMVNDIKIYWPYFVAHNMLKFTKSDLLGMLTYGLESLNTWALMLVVKVGEEFLKTTSSMNEEFIIWEGVWKKAKNNNHLHHLKSKLLKNKPVLPSNLQ
ncbi:hypothetical protein PIB30_106099, partial [Stylosanthes scabra]|nr:hypothetical protein [Stylosanthes scabra]